MSAYIVSDITVRDRDAFEDYRTRAAKAVAQYGGRYIVRGGAIEVLEGGHVPANIVIVEFPDGAAARAWYGSPEYAEALAFRDRALTRNLIVVEGIAADP